MIYWGLNEGDILPCCWLNYSRFKETTDILTKFDNLFRIGFSNNEVKQHLSKFNKFKQSFWVKSEYPHLSFKGRILSIITIIFVLVSLFNIIFVTFRPWYVNTIEMVNGTEITKSYPSSYFQISDIICTIYFTALFLIRVICCPNRRHFFRSIFNWVELIALVGFYLQIITRLVNMDNICYEITDCKYNSTKIMPIFQFLRIGRLAQLFKSYSGMQVLVYTLKSSIKELFLILSLLFSAVIVFAFLMYTIEGDPNDAKGFINMSVSFWYTLTTMTTGIDLFFDVLEIFYFIYFH